MTSASWPLRHVWETLTLPTRERQIKSYQINTTNCLTIICTHCFYISAQCFVQKESWVETGKEALIAQFKLHHCKKSFTLWRESHLKFWWVLIFRDQPTSLSTYASILLFKSLQVASGGFSESRKGTCTLEPEKLIHTHTFTASVQVRGEDQ